MPTHDHDHDHDHHDHHDHGDHQPATVTDPVCGMTIDPATAAATAEHDGTTYFFCAPGCHRQFSADPTRYLTQTPDHRH